MLNPLEMLTAPSARATAEMGASMTQEPTPTPLIKNHPASKFPSHSTIELLYLLLNKLTPESLLLMFFCREDPS